MIAELREQFPDLPGSILWKTGLLFRGVCFTGALAEAVAEGAAPNFWPYRRRDARGQLELIPVPYLFRLEGGAVARVRVDDRSALDVRRDAAGFGLWSGSERLCAIEFVRAHAWQDHRTRDGSTPSAAGVEQLGDMLVVNVAPGCEYFTVRDEEGDARRCRFCAYGRFDQRSVALGQARGRVPLEPALLARLEEVLRVAAEAGEARHVYLTGGSLLDPADEARRYLPLVAAARRAVGDRLRVTCGSGAVDPKDSARYRDAGADSCCYNLEVWDAETFRAVCPGKAAAVGRERWIAALLGAVEVFGRGNVGSAFVAGVEQPAPAPGMSTERMMASIVEGATFLLDHGVMPLYSPLWPVEGTPYGAGDGLAPERYLEIEREVYRLRAARRFPVPPWLICRGCSYMLLEVDFDHALGLAA
ncbi:MAG: hypothetical protein A3F92_13935 [Candidatus Rokubacteria bacterium RIFCSPLOWO2_12_FULL_71_22]|nr:MAG: hypothetical protein A3F92_13935 [Candidatus Rokubacteria bacterium RIFCSPLOWO2_12_FULL_71_22]